MVIELQRISLLWDELWVGTIQQYGAEINRRVKKMDEEVNRLNVNASLSVTEKKSLAKEKYNIVFKPLLYVFDKVSLNQLLLLSVNRSSSKWSLSLISVSLRGIQFFPTY